MLALNDTHDPARRSWVESANEPGTDFPIQNLPFGIFRRQGEAPRAGVAIGDSIFDLAAAYDAGLFSGQAAQAAEAAREPSLNRLMALDPELISVLRARISDLLRADGTKSGRARALKERLVVPMAEAQVLLPCQTRSYTDFLTSIHHTERNGRLKGLKDPVPATFKYVPVAYHSRSSSLVPSGTPVRRPYGQWRDESGQIRFGPAESLDYELELGLFIGQGNELGAPIPIEEAERHFFGFCLLNDWSTKEIQWWEQMLGPFLGKSFTTSISPWIVTAEALAPFRLAPEPRPAGDPAPLPYLSSEADQAAGGFNIDLQAYLSTARMREQGEEPVCITRTSSQTMYWTFAQMVAHHTVNGCNLETGDLLGSGTLSGADEASRGCLVEQTMRGAEPITLPNGERRAWLHDGDEVVLRGRAQREGFVSIGFGECRGRIEPADVAWLDAKRV